MLLEVIDSIPVTVNFGEESVYERYVTYKATDASGRFDDLIIIITLTVSKVLDIPSSKEQNVLRANRAQYARVSGCFPVCLLIPTILPPFEL